MATRSVVTEKQAAWICFSGRVGISLWSSRCVHVGSSFALFRFLILSLSGVASSQYAVPLSPSVGVVLRYPLFVPPPSLPLPNVLASSGRGALEVLQLSVQQEGEADMDVELLRKGLLAVKLKGEEEGRNKKGRGGKGGGGGGASASADAEEETDFIMPGVCLFYVCLSFLCVKV